MNSKKVGISIAIILIIVAVFGIIFFVLPKEKEEIIYKITFNNDVVSEVIEVKEENSITKPTVPEREGYDFDGWYHNGTGKDSQMLVMGGTYTDFNPANNLSEGENTNFLVDEYKVVEANGKYFVEAAS